MNGLNALQVLLDAENALFANTYDPSYPYDDEAFWDAIGILRDASLLIRYSIWKEINGGYIGQLVSKSPLALAINTAKTKY
jgi:hypothetical protein